MPESRQVRLRRKLTRDGGGQPPGYQKTLMPTATMPFASDTDGGHYLPGWPVGRFDLGQMSTIYHRWRYEVTQADLPHDEGGMWLLSGIPTWMDSIVDAGAIQFDVTQPWPGLWTITYPPNGPMPAYPIVESVRFGDDWVLQTSPTPPTMTWYARLTHTPGEARVANDIEGTSPGIPFWLRRHDIHSIVIHEDHTRDVQTYTEVCNFYPFMGG